MAYWAITDGRRWYTGNVKRGTLEPICDGERDDAMEMDDEEVATDFPGGLPPGWQKEKL